jgi:hypothetical protein
MSRPSTFVVALVLMASSSRAAEPSGAGVKVAGAAAVRTINIARGRATVERAGDGEKVVVTDDNGSVLSESWCDDKTGSYDEIVALFHRLQKTVAARDSQSVATLLRFPLQVNGAKRLTINSRAVLLRRYDRVFRSDVIEKIVGAEAAAVFCRNGQAMFGDGIVWAHVDHGRAGIDVVSQQNGRNHGASQAGPARKALHSLLR